MSKKTNIKISIQARYIAMLHPFAATDETRHYLNGIHFEPNPKKHGGGVLAVTTDGHRMGIIRDILGECTAPITLPIPSYVLAACKKKAHSFEFYNGTVTVTEFDSVEPLVNTNISRVGGTYPDWRSILPFNALKAKYQNRPIGFNPQYISDFGAVSKYSGVEKISAIFHCKDPKSATVVRFPAVPEFVGVIMPMRLSEPEIGTYIPNWLQKPKEKND